MPRYALMLLPAIFCLAGGLWICLSSAVRRRFVETLQERDRWMRRLPDRYRQSVPFVFVGIFFALGAECVLIALGVIRR